MGDAATANGIPVWHVKCRYPPLDTSRARIVHEPIAAFLDCILRGRKEMQRGITGFLRCMRDSVIGRWILAGAGSGHEPNEAS